jgi:CRP-like cAMP-binding protein
MKIKKTPCDLKTCSMCNSCLPEWLPAIDANRKFIQYKKGELLFNEGEQVKGMFFIHTGLVKVHKKWTDEKELILRFANNGAIAGHRGLGADTIYPVSATALTITEVCFIDLDFFYSTLKVNTNYMYELLLFFAAELKESERKMRNLAHMDTKGRIANAILNFHEKFGLNEEGFIDLPISRQDLASYTGTTYETLFRIMNELSEQNLIAINKGNIKILDTAALNQLQVND